MNGTPESVLNEPELLRLLLPAIRADFRLCENYSLREGVLDCPIRVFGGAHDDGVRERHLEGWRNFTSSDCTVRLLPGDHFFIHDSFRLMLRAIAVDLASATGNGKRSSAIWTA
jgi:surfactin synthase thioesterase subunit